MVIALGERGWKVNRKRVQRLMQTMGIQAIYPKPRLSDPAPGQRIYPYRLRGLPITRPNQVWGTDITYIRLRNGFIYLVAILDWYSRYVVDWEVSVTLDTGFCLSTLDRALQKAKPEIFNSDQGAQFTSEEFTERLEKAGVLISMDPAWTRDGQHLHRAVVAKREVRRGLLKRLRWRAGRDRKFEKLFWALQFPAAAPVTEQSNARRDLLRDSEQDREVPKTGRTPDRPCCRSSFIGHPGAKVLQPHGQNKEAAAQPLFIDES